MVYEELDDETRRWMRVEFLAEEPRLPYRGPSLSPVGRGAFPCIMEIAIMRGTEEALARNLNDPVAWAEYGPSPRGGVRKTDPERAAGTLARDEFNTWCVRGLCRRLMGEGKILSGAWGRGR